MMKTIKKILTIFLMVTLVMLVANGRYFSLTVYAAEDEEEKELPQSDAWDKLHAFGSNASHWLAGKASDVAETVKEKGPGWADSAKEGIKKGQEKTQEVYSNSQTDFWGDFEHLTGQETGLSGRDTSVETPPNEALSDGSTPGEEMSAEELNRAVGSTAEIDAQDAQAANTDNSDAIESAKNTEQDTRAEDASSRSDSDTPTETAATEVKTEDAVKDTTEADVLPEMTLEPNRWQKFFRHPAVRAIILIACMILSGRAGIALAKSSRKK